MNSQARLLSGLCLVTGLVAAKVFLPAVRGQVWDSSPNLAPGTQTEEGKNPIQGYLRTNRTTGQPEQVRTHTRRSPKPKAVVVQSYTRKGQPVAEHQRQPPLKNQMC